MVNLLSGNSSVSVKGIDLRTKLLFVLTSGFSMLLFSSPEATAMTIILVLPLLVLQGQKGLAAFMVAGTAALWMMYDLLLLQGGIALGLLAYICFFIAKTLPMVCICISLAKTARLGELFALLGKTRAPLPLTLSLAVTCRFIPTLAGDYGRIRDAARARGLKTGLADALLHPLQRIERLLLPLIMRAVRLADEVSATALTRGIESPLRREYRLTPLGMRDAALMGWNGMVCIATLVLYAQGLLS